MEGSKRQKLRRLYYFTLAFLLLCLIGSGVSIVCYQVYNANYHRYMSDALAGMQHLRTGAALLEALPKNLFDSHTVSKAQEEFATALTNFEELDSVLQPFSFVGTRIPVYGTRFATALHLVSLAIDVSEAGVDGCTLLKVLLPQFHEPLKMQGHGLTLADFFLIEQVFLQMKLALNAAISEANSLHPGDLGFDPRLATAFTSVKSQLPTLQTWLTASDSLFPVLPVLLGIGSPANYLVEVLDSTELRPAGGFIGNYGIATISSGQLTAVKIRDVSLIDRPFKDAGKKIAYPANYAWFANYLAPEGWSLRDSNLDADFPTAARNGELNYTREGGPGPVLGVIAITPALIEGALEITGPVTVPEYGETITASNLIGRIHYHQLGPAGEGSGFVASPDGHSSLRKRFTELLAEHLLARIQKLPAASLPRILQLLANSVRSKDIQVYFNAVDAEDALSQLHLDGSIASPMGDGLFVVDANVSPNKANSFIRSTLNDQVTIDAAAGDALHTTTIRYAWTIPGQNYGRALYRDYVRVYVPPGSTLQSQDGWQFLGRSNAFGREVWAGFFTFSYGQSRTITLQWMVPGVARKDIHGWHYVYLIQRQAGKTEMVNLSITLPLSAGRIRTWGGLVSRAGQKAELTQALSEDLSVGIDYSG